MVLMMDGTDTMYGPQVAAALFGYLMGTIGAISSYIAGTHVIECFHHSGNASEQCRQNDTSGVTSVFHRRAAVVLVLISTSLVIGLLLGDFYYHVQMYRELWMAALLSPLGALLRWNLMKWNAASKKGFPWGTWSANVIAALLCSFVTAVSSFVVLSDDPWAVPALQALGAGFAGSLSTVSSLVHEIAIVESLRQAYGYVFATIVPTMLMSLLIYVPIARFW